MSGLRGVQFFGNYIESYTPLTPSFPRKRESRASLPIAALPLPNLMDSRFRGNDGMGGNNDGEEDV